MPKSKRGLLVVLSGPSGVGKSTIVKRILKNNPKLVLSVSCTTRNPRPGEKNGREYFFISRKEFEEKIKREEFLEWARVHNSFYGTPKEFIEKCLDRNKNIILEVDVQGAESIKRTVKSPAVFIFVIPPSVEILAFRLKRRKTESKEIRESRLKAAIAELQVMEKYDYIVVNDKVDHAAKKINAIINVEKERMMKN